MKIGLYIICLLTIAGCISNDIPLPVIYGNVEKIEFQGQEQCVINTQNRTVTVTLSDKVDIQNVLLQSLTVTAKPAREHTIKIEAQTTLSSDTVLNLVNPITFIISTYQDYEWTIIAEQNIKYNFAVDNQIGEAIINQNDKMVKLYVPMDQDLANMQVTEAILGPPIATYSPDPLTITDFNKTQEIEVTCFGRTETWYIFAFRTSATEPMTKGVNAWAKIAYLSGRKPSGINGTTAFEYKKASGASWTRIEAQGSGRDFSARVTGLTPNTSYICRAIVGETLGEEVTFTTERTTQIPYSNFDSWYSTTDPNVSYNIGVLGEISWDSGNRGGATFKIEPTKSTTDATKGLAACLTSEWAVVKFAAGSIYTGYFEGMADLTNAKLRFGIPYTSRPTSLKGFYKYLPKKVDRNNNKPEEEYASLINTIDSCHIYIALCNWTEPYAVNSATKNFVDLSTKNKSIIALGELKHNQTISEYTPFTINLEYRDLTKQPTYILIVGTSSKYGDYFVGGTGSQLFLDELTLGFD